MTTLQSSQGRSLAFDIFCQVIDNYGDIGVCWRLARQLAQTPRASKVRLWVDNLARFKQLEPSISATLGQQRVSNVDIVHWHASTPIQEPHEVVIEAFGCNPPPHFIDAMVHTNSLWLNLEYLSAESWIDGFHLQPSVQSNGLRKYFFFPGFTAHTGGLLREPGLIEERLAWKAQTARRDALLQSCGISTTDISALNEGARLVFLFCYRDAPVPTLIDVLAQQPDPTIVLIPSGVYPGARSSENGSVHVYPIPFVSQKNFDHLLWSADLNIVRGEDSLVRALWAARPMIWQPYPQEDDVHLDKLDAWLKRSPLHADTQTLIRSWTTRDTTSFRHGLIEHLHPGPWSRWSRQSRQWSDQLADQTDLITSLLRFCTQQQRTG